ncbi:MAG: LuxR C-terminal-related transcriptional regulator [Porticoccaceae bacterium]|nr:LuxR C-terminal-related transcriptional regulator [Porticoccaceae bacterium]
MIVIRTFLDGALSGVTTWEIASALDNTDKDKVAHRIQINLILKKILKKKQQIFKESNQNSFHFVVTTESNAQQHVKDILLEKEIVGLTKSLTEREVEILKELYQVKNTKKAASNLHISPRTFANHRFNITKKTAMPAAEAADFLFNCSNAELFTAMLDGLNN